MKISDIRIKLVEKDDKKLKAFASITIEDCFVVHDIKVIEGKDGYYCFHAGTKVTEEGLVTNGGRVLGITAKGSNLKEARANAYEATKWVNFDNKYMRNDIGKAIDEA